MVSLVYLKHLLMDIQTFFFVMLILSTVMAEQMDWGDNHDLVEEANYIEGRENVKIMVVIEGEDIELECQVLSTSDPVSEISWEINGKKEKTNEQPIISTAYGEVFIQSHLQMSNISRDRDGSSVSCNYAKGQYGGSVRAVLAVFKMQFCQAGGGDVTIKTKEAGRGSPGETHVEDKIKAKISNITFTDEDQITAENGDYSVTVPHNTVYPQLITDGLDNIQPCEGVTIVTTSTITTTTYIATTTPSTTTIKTTTFTTTTTTTIKRTTSTTTTTTTTITTSTTTTSISTTTTSASTTTTDKDQATTITTTSMIIPTTAITITSTTGDKTTMITTETTATTITTRTTTARITTTRSTIIIFPKHIKATLITAEISIIRDTVTIVTRIKLKTNITIEGTTGINLLVCSIKYLNTWGTTWIDLTKLKVDGYTLEIQPTLQTMLTIESPRRWRFFNGWTMTMHRCTSYSFSYCYNHNWYPINVLYRDSKWLHV